MMQKIDKTLGVYLATATFGLASALFPYSARAKDRCGELLEYIRGTKASVSELEIDLSSTPPTDEMARNYWYAQKIMISGMKERTSEARTAYEICRTTEGLGRRFLPETTPEQQERNRRLLECMAQAEDLFECE